MRGVMIMTKKDSNSTAIERVEQRPPGRVGGWCQLLEQYHA